MKDKDINNDFNHIFPEGIRDDFLFSLDSYRLYLWMIFICLAKKWMSQ